MRLLPDTHALLWWDGQADSLSDAAQAALQDTGNTVYMSVVNAWEIQIKTQLGKLTLHKPLHLMFDEQHSLNGLELLLVDLPTFSNSIGCRSTTRSPSIGCSSLRPGTRI